MLILVRLFSSLRSIGEGTWKQGGIVAPKQAAGVLIHIGMLPTTPLRQGAISWTRYIGRICRWTKTYQD